VVRDTRSPQPGAPEPPGGGDPGRGVVDVRWTRQLLGPRERAERPVTRLQHVSGPDAAALHPEREVGPQADRLAGTGRVGRVPPAVAERTLRRADGGDAH